MITLLICLFISSTCIGQNTAWKEMDDFHEMVSKLLHPVESGNLQPLKTNSQSLLDKAKAWQASPAPSAFRYPQLKTDLDTLVAACTNLNDAVKIKKSNKEIKNLAMQTHMIFHSILSSMENRQK